MTDQRFIIEMGMGNALDGMDYQRAATRAIKDAYSHVTLPMWDSLEMDPNQMRIQVTVGVQAPDQLDTQELAALIPRGIVDVRAVQGGQNATHPGSGKTAVIATAAVEAFLPYQGESWRSGTD